MVPNRATHHTFLTRNLVMTSLLNFKIVVAKTLIGRYSNRKKSFPTSRTSKRKSHEPSMPIGNLTHMPKFQEMQIRCHCYKNKGLDYKTFVPCHTRGLCLCLTKERNCFWSIICSFTLLITYLFENKRFFCRLLGFFLS